MTTIPASKPSLKLSFVLPAYKEEQNLNALIPRILAQRENVGDIEIVIVDDHSPDGTFGVVRAWARKDPSIRGVRLAKNAGSHMAALCGLSECTGDAAIVLAADGQDPPEFSSELVREWAAGAQVVWAIRAKRDGESAMTIAFSRAYYRIMNRFTTVRLPRTGADFFLLDRRVIDVVKGLSERNTSLVALIAWLGFRTAEVYYEKQARSGGRSSWTFAKKTRLALDSLFGFSVFPMRLASWIGFLYAFGGFAYAVVLIVNKLTLGRLFGAVAAEGWSALMVMILISSGTFMLVLGLFGEYMWRTLEEVRGRPRFLIEDSVHGAVGGKAGPEGL